MREGRLEAGQYRSILTHMVYRLRTRQKPNQRDDLPMGVRLKSQKRTRAELNSVMPWLGEGAVCLLSERSKNQNSMDTQ